MTAPTPDPLALAVDIARERATFTPGAALLRAWSRRHPAVVQLGDVVQAIERCGASIALTDAVVLCGSLREAIHDALDQRDALAAALRAAHEENQRLREALMPLAAVSMQAVDLGQDLKYSVLWRFTEDQVLAARKALAGGKGEG